MKTMKLTSLLILLALALVPGCSLKNRAGSNAREVIASDSLFIFTKNKALEIVQSGFSAGDKYEEVWIRDYNTFIELSAEVFEPEVMKEYLMVFFRMQGDDGNIIDGYIPREKVGGLGYDYIYSDMEPRYAGHKNTVETDQETSLIQAVYKYVQTTGDWTILDEMVGDISVGQRMENALGFLMNHRFNHEYGLLWGATTADWGDVQPEHEWGVYLTDDTHYAIDIYDNAMFLVALDNFMELVPDSRKKWQRVRDDIAANARKHLWDSEKQKFIPHIYLNGSPFPEDFNEEEVFYHGGTAVAIEAGLLTEDEIVRSLEQMVDNVQKAGAASIGLTLYPPYPEGSFKNKSMVPYGYQNGGDWTWFGARMIQQLIRYGFVDEAYEHILPMVKRVKENDGFYEWYTIDNEPRGAGTFRGSAGVLFKAIRMFEELESFSFVQLCDPQLGMGEYEDDKARFEQAVRQINALGADFVLICGDFVQHASDSSFADYIEIRNGLNVPFYEVPGNHDIGRVPNDTTLAAYRSIFGKDYFEFMHEDTRFVLVNTLLWKTDIGKESSMHDDWFRTTLQKSDGNGRVIVAGHFPIFTKDPGEEENYFNLPPEKRLELLQMFKENNVVAYLSGHKHELITHNYEGIQLVSGESTAKNFDQRPYGFRKWNIYEDTVIHRFVALDIQLN
jgi:predicted phosphodiesterase